MAICTGCLRAANANTCCERGSALEGASRRRQFFGGLPFGFPQGKKACASTWPALPPGTLERIVGRSDWSELSSSRRAYKHRSEGRSQRRWRGARYRDSPERRKRKDFSSDGLLLSLRHCAAKASNFRLTLRGTDPVSAIRSGDGPNVQVSDCQNTGPGD